MAVEFTKYGGVSVQDPKKPFTTSGGSSKRKVDPYAEKRKQCKLNGGTWDAVRKVCVMPEVKKEAPKPTAPQRNRIYSKPEGTDSSRNIDITDLTEKEREDIQRKHALEGQEIKRLRDEQELEEATALARRTVYPEQVAEEEAAQKRIEGFKQPEVRQLDPTPQTGLEKVPIIGGAIASVSNILYDTLASGVFGEKVAERAKKAQGISPELLQNVARTEIEKQVYEEGLTASEKAGSILESFGAGALRKIGVGVIETPVGNVETMVRTIRTEKGRATEIATQVTQGILKDKEKARENVEDIELEIQRLQSRIKLLSEYSPELRFNSDGINKIEQEILRAEEVLRKSKVLIEQGQQEDPTDTMLLMAMATDEGEFKI